jgi:hypothetical protein
VSCADLGQKLASRCHGLRLERLLRRIGEDFHRQQAGQKAILGQGIDHGQAAVAIQGHVHLAKVGARHFAGRALGLHLQGALPARHEPQHALVAHVHPGLAADRFQLPVWAINQLGEHAGVYQSCLAAQGLEGLLCLLWLAVGPHHHQNLAPVENLSAHAKHRALLEALCLFAQFLPSPDVSVGFIPLARFSAPHHGPVAQLGRHRRRSANLPGLLAADFRAALAFGKEAQAARGTGANGHPRQALGNGHRHNREALLGETKLGRVDRAQLVRTRELVSRTRRRCPSGQGPSDDYQVQVPPAHRISCAER